MSQFLFQPLVKMTIALLHIPEQFWDYQLRKLSARIQYNLIVIGLEYNEY